MSSQWYYGVPAFAICSTGLCIRSISCLRSRTTRGINVNRYLGVPYSVNKFQVDRENRCCSHLPVKICNRWRVRGFRRILDRVDSNGMNELKY
ncbi:hypothetical protein T310_7437 [Rasamsonia emersonii CBS 393.64]|uniref:Uncharacterized protein n=1 Tax=Rasamsonia emersonii (strain ATCC 16479 / CBS 393.64 / IMI 116815) TaxID=1408163 RepID=A0A0F4YL73_RASE3|nr:hypothetical protein T310_7437 [Rasamsonia emersonii CBS 393.64]KKA18616.1 hypothetical protein T310_7437 [Rasamsonia emersonii CBS 393.64]